MTTSGTIVLAALPLVLALAVILGARPVARAYHWVFGPEAPRYRTTLCFAAAFGMLAVGDWHRHDRWESLTVLLAVFYLALSVLGAVRGRRAESHRT